MQLWPKQIHRVTCYPPSLLLNLPSFSTVENSGKTPVALERLDLPERFFPGIMLCGPLRPEHKDKKKNQNTKPQIIRITLTLNH